MGKVVWLNGVLSSAESVGISPVDHAFLYGDGLFEGIRMYGRKVFRLSEHLDRLYHGMTYLGYEKTLTKPELHSAILKTCAASDFADGYIRLNVTRGTGLGLDPKNIDCKPSVMILVSELALYPKEAYETGLHVVTSTFRVIPADSLDPKVKCIGRYASNILAKQEGNRRGAGEALMLNHQGHVAECTGDNIFIFKDGELRTPHSNCGLLNGITRQTVINLARADGMTVVEGVLSPFDVHSADEAFLTGTGAEVIPMVSLDSQPIGSGKPGKLTHRIMDLYRKETTTTGDPY